MNYDNFLVNSCGVTITALPDSVYEDRLIETDV